MVRLSIFAVYATCVLLISSAQAAPQRKSQDPQTYDTTSGVTSALDLISFRNLPLSANDLLNRLKGG